MILPSSSLCERCRHLREVYSGKGSRFLLCGIALTNRDLPKYPRQPVRTCPVYQPRESGPQP